MNQIPQEYVEKFTCAFCNSKQFEKHIITDKIENRITVKFIHNCSVVKSIGPLLINYETGSYKNSFDFISVWGKFKNHIMVYSRYAAKAYVNMPDNIWLKYKYFKFTGDVLETRSLLHKLNFEIKDYMVYENYNIYKFDQVKHYFNDEGIDWILFE